VRITGLASGIQLVVERSIAVEQRKSAEVGEFGCKPEGKRTAPPIEREHFHHELSQM
jgi:hypothetical protein